MKKDIVAFADESPFTLEDWQRAQKTLLEWCNERAIKVDEDQALSYIHCCSLASLMKPIVGTLESITLEYLNEYGIESSLPPKS